MSDSPPGARQALWHNLSVIEAALGDGYLDSRAALPDFSQISPPACCAEAYAHEPADESIETIRAEALRCLKCRLAASRSHVVFGSGPQHPVVLVVGESPGQEEDHSGKPFAGDAGLLLDKMLASIGLSREANTYLATIVKCRPPMNRDPAPDEQNACMHFLTRQMAALKPKAILALGRIPSQALLKTRDGIAKLRATVWNYNGIPLIATYHPNALLREETLKRPAWEDLKLLKSVLADG